VALNKIKPLWALTAVGIVLMIGAAIAHHRLLSSRAVELLTINDEIHRTANDNAAAERALSDLPGLRESVRRFAKQVPPDSDLSPLLESVGSDLTPGAAPEREIVTKPTIPGQPVARIPFSLQYRGSFSGTVALLDRLHNGSLFTRVERIVMERGTGTEANHPLRVTVDFSTFARTSKELEAWAQVEQ
jgi:hypothetical protein